MAMNSELHAWVQRQTILRKRGSASVESSYVIARKPDGKLREDRPQPGSPVLPGSFNPLHAGHLEMARIAVETCQRPCWFEISTDNVDKAALHLDELIDRIQQDFGEHGLILTNTPQFSRKSQILPGSVFAVGSDTMQRILDPSYLSPDQNLPQLARTFLRLRIRFLVFGRTIGDEFHDQHHFRMNAEFEQLCSFIPRKRFEMDVSSTAIRERTSRRN